MKFFRYILFSWLIVLIFISCKKEHKKPWEIEIKQPIQKVEITNISEEFYNPNISLDAFKEKYPWFQGTVSDADFLARKTDTTEVKIYKESVSKLNFGKLQQNLESLFYHIKYYFPEFVYPKVFLYSSSLQSVKEPIFYVPEEQFLFIDLSAFMGEKNKYYDGLDRYFKTSMNPENLVPKVSQIVSENLFREDLNHQKFIDKMVYQGKIQILQDAFLPNTPDYLKINYTKAQYQWAKENEANIWNYFVENNLLYSDDPNLGDRFINPGPFSKFYTAVDRESSPQIGIFTGWQICRKFYQEKPDTKLSQFLKMDAETIFKESQYKPK